MKCIENRDNVHQNKTTNITSLSFSQPCFDDSFQTSLWDSDQFDCPDKKRTMFQKCLHWEHWASFINLCSTSYSSIRSVLIQSKIHMFGCVDCDMIHVIEKKLNNLHLMNEGQCDSSNAFCTTICHVQGLLQRLNWTVGHPCSLIE